MGKPIRIPRTTAMFITGLGRILRDKLSLVITEHEHWTFDHRGEWARCTRPGECGLHGVSDAYLAKVYKEYGPPPWRDWDHSYSPPCMPDVMNVYLATGQVHVRGCKVELRARIEHTCFDFGLDLYEVQLWLRDEARDMTRGVYMLHEDGRPYVVSGRVCPESPPSRIAFWRSAEELVETV